jgi:Serine dehydrogenase proteinase
MADRGKSLDPAVEDRKARAKRVAAAVEKIELESGADVLFINGPMDGAIDTTVIKKVCARNRRKNLFLILTTEGGSADCAFRIGRCLQESYDTFTAVIPGWCKSAGTLVCIGAYDLIVGDLGELGPLDVQLAKPDELTLIASGLSVDSAFRSLKTVAFQMFETFLLDTLNKSSGRITTKTASEIAANMTVGLLSPIFQQMDPMKIGEDYRSTLIAEQYALRLDAHARAQNLIHDDEMDAADILVRGYPSHRFVIDRTEARLLFHRVSSLEGALAELADALGDALTPLTSPRQQSVVEYLNEGVADEEQRSADVANDAGKPSEPTAQQASRGDDAGPIQDNPAGGDGVVAVPISTRPAQAAG